MKNYAMGYATRWGHIGVAKMGTAIYAYAGPVYVGLQLSPERWALKLKYRGQYPKFGLAIGPLRVEVLR